MGRGRKRGGGEREEERRWEARGEKGLICGGIKLTLGSGSPLELVSVTDAPINNKMF